MDYSVMLARCKRMIGLQDGEQADLLDIVQLLHRYPAGISRHVIAEKLLHEMAEFIEAEIKVPVPPVKH